jgi:hypothetical protein
MQGMQGPINFFKNKSYGRRRRTIKYVDSQFFLKKRKFLENGAVEKGERNE